jgi:hypothetical protein
MARGSGIAPAALAFLLGSPFVGCLGVEPSSSGTRLGDAAVVVPDPDASAEPDASVSDVAAVEVDPADAGLAAWTGTWAFTKGSSGVNCAGTISASTMTGVLSIEPGASANHLTILESGCSFSFALAGATATSDPPGQSCAVWSIPTIPEWTLTMKSDGTLTEKLGGEVAIGGSACLVSGMFTLVRQ